MATIIVFVLLNGKPFLFFFEGVRHIAHRDASLRAKFQGRSQADSQQYIKKACLLLRSFS
jgi:hypothetical protein